MRSRFPFLQQGQGEKRLQLAGPQVSEGDRAALAVMLNSEIPFERLLVFNLGNQLAIDESLDAGTLANHLEFIPFLGLEYPLGPFLVFGFLALGRVEPTTHPYTVNSTRFGLVDFALVALWFALTSHESETQTGVETFIIERDFDLCFDLEILHLQIGYDPNVDLREELQFSVLGHKGFDLGPRSPSLGGLSVKEGIPFPFLLFGKERGGGKQNSERKKKMIHFELGKVQRATFAKRGVTEGF